MKEQIRANLKMIEEHISMFNEHALQFIDKKRLRHLISINRWFISHDYFKEGHDKPEGLYSPPPIGWLNSVIQGQTVPLHKDIGTCIAPVVQSGLMTEHAAKRIMNAVESIYRYISPEDMKEHSKAQYKRKVTDKREAVKRAIYEKERRAKKAKEDHQKRLEDPVYLKKLANKRKKQKDKQRKDAAEKLKADRAEAKRILLEQLKRDKKDGR